MGSLSIHSLHLGLFWYLYECELSLGFWVRKLRYLGPFLYHLFSGLNIKNYGLFRPSMDRFYLTRPRLFFISFLKYIFF